MEDNSEWVTGNVTLSVNGQPLAMQMTVPARPVKPQRMLPIFRQMTDSFVAMGVSAAEAEGRSVSCRAGCNACCRQMVPIPEFEAYRLAEVVAEMPEERRLAVIGRFQAACETFAAAGIFDRLSHVAELGAADRLAVVVDYFNENIACPFLEDERCSIYSERPVACREYLVSSPAEYCSELKPDTIDEVPLPVKPSEPLRRLGQSARIAGADFIPHVLALKWVEKNPDHFPEKSGEEWMADFFGLLTNRAVPTSPRPTEDIDKKFGI